MNLISYSESISLFCTASLVLLCQFSIDFLSTSTHGTVEGIFDRGSVLESFFLGFTFLSVKMSCLKIAVFIVISRYYCNKTMFGS